LGGYQLEPRAKTILRGLAFRERDFDRPARAMSGGWVMRAYIARLLVQQPDLLMLDEPTNHLDLEALRWLQEYLKGYPGAILLISHDREFLNQLVGSIVEIRQRRLLRYRGNYDDYLVQREAQAAQLLAAYENQQKKIEQLQTFADRFRAKASKAAQAQSKLKQIERMDKIEAPSGRARRVLPFSPAAPQRTAGDVAGGYPPCLWREHRVPRYEFRAGARPAPGAGRAQRRGQIHIAQTAGGRAAGAEGRARTGSEREGGLLRAVPGGDVESGPHRAAGGQRSAAAGTRADHPHRAGIVSVYGRRRVQARVGVERRRKKPAGARAPAARSAESIADGRADHPSGHEQHRGVDRRHARL
jgi:energy-coupling factor transporter ATP-binding protein EcfA2